MLFFVKIVALLVILVAIYNYPKWSYKKFYERSEINAKHPKWKPNCGVNFMKEDPQWFIDNGYGDYVKEYAKG